MYQRAHCLFVKGISLGKDDLRFLYLGACHMAQQDRSELVVDISEGRVVLTTDYEIGFMGHLCGIKFTAQIEVGPRQASTSFLVKQDDLQEVTTLEDLQSYSLITWVAEANEQN